MNRLEAYQWLSEQFRCAMLQHPNGRIISISSLIGLLITLLCE